MKLTTLLRGALPALLLLFSLPGRADTLGQYNMGANSAGNGVLTPTASAPHVIATDITADAGLALDLASPATQPANSPYLRTTFNTVSTTQAAAFTNNANFKFTLTADTGYLLNLTALDFDGFRGGASTPRGWAVRSSVDNYASVLATADFPTARPEITHVNIPLTGAAFQNLSTITFKVYSYSPAAGNSVDYDSFVVSGTTALIPVTGYNWKGNVSSDWDTTTANWSGLGTIYVDNTATSDVIFDDLASTGTVTVTAAGLSPHFMIVSNSTVPYIFNGGGLAVTSTLTKSGTASMTINNAVTAASTSFGGGIVTVGSGGSLTSLALGMTQTGTLTVSATGSLGGSSALTASGTVNFNNAAQSLAGLAGANTGIVALNGTALTVTGSSSSDAKLTGTGSLVKSTGGTLVLGSATSDFSGGTVISGGTLQLSGPAAAGTGGVLVNAGGSVAIGAAIPNTVTMAGGIIGTAAGTPMPGNLVVNVPTTVQTFNPGTGATTNDLIITGMLQGSGNINLQTINGNVPDSQAFRLRGPSSTGVNAYTGTITLAPSGKFELQNNAASGSPMGTGTIVMTAGTNPTTNQGTYSLLNVRNASGLAVVSDTTFGNNVRITGSGVAYFNMLNVGGGVLAGSRSNFGDLLIGDGQAVGAVSTATAGMTLGFATVHLTGGNATFTPQPVGNTNFVAVENISLGTISENVLGSGIIMNGAATLTITGAGTYTGPTSVQSGTLCVTGSIDETSSLTVAPGATFCADGPTTLTFGGTITNDGTIRISRGATLNAANAAAFVNNGLLDLVSGNAVLPPHFTNGPTGIVLDASSRAIKTVSRTGTLLTLAVDSYTNHTYQLQYSTTPGSGFTNVGAPQTGSTGVELSFSYDTGADPRGFFRVVVDQ